MRVDDFLSLLENYNFEKLVYLMSNPVINGGLEVWCQVDIGTHLLRQIRVDDFLREGSYPEGEKRCDWVFIKNNGRFQEKIYLELKTFNPFRTLEECFNNFISDVNKVVEEFNGFQKEARLYKSQITVMCLLIFYGDIRQFNAWEANINQNYQKYLYKRTKEYPNGIVLHFIFFSYCINSLGKVF